MRWKGTGDNLKLLVDFDMCPLFPIDETGKWVYQPPLQVRNELGISEGKAKYDVHALFMATILKGAHKMTEEDKFTTILTNMEEGEGVTMQDFYNGIAIPGNGLALLILNLVPSPEKELQYDVVRAIGEVVLAFHKHAKLWGGYTKYKFKAPEQESAASKQLTARLKAGFSTELTAEEIQAAAAWSESEDN